MTRLIYSSILLSIIAADLFWNQSQYMTAILFSIIFSVFGALLGTTSENPFRVFWLSVLAGAFGACVGGGPMKIGKLLWPAYGMVIGFLVGQLAISFGFLAEQSDEKHKDHSGQPRVQDSVQSGAPKEKPLIKILIEVVLVLLIGPLMGILWLGVKMLLDHRSLSNRLLIQDSLDDLPGFIILGLIVSGVIAFLYLASYANRDAVGNQQKK